MKTLIEKLEAVKYPNPEALGRMFNHGVDVAAKVFDQHEAEMLQGDMVERVARGICKSRDENFDEILQHGRTFYLEIAKAAIRSMLPIMEAPVISAPLETGEFAEYPNNAITGASTKPDYEWRPIETVPKDGTNVILYFSLGTCRVPYVAKYRKGYMDESGVMDWETVRPIPADAPTGWLPIIYKDYMTAPIMGDASTRKDEKPIPFDNTEALKRVKEVLEKYYPQEKGRLYDIFTGYVLNVYMNALMPITPVTKGGEETPVSKDLVAKIRAAQMLYFDKNNIKCDDSDLMSREEAQWIAREIQQPSGDAWQPIETMPKVRKCFLVYCAEKENIYLVWYDSEDKNPRLFHFGSHSGADGGLHETPTHWMPLPPPPRPSDKEEAAKQERSAQNGCAACNGLDGRHYQGCSACYPSNANHEMIGDCPIYSDYEREGMLMVFNKAQKHHGMYESLFAVSTFILRTRGHLPPVRINTLTETVKPRKQGE